MKKSVLIDIWYYCFGYIGIDAVRNMVRKRLVNRLGIIGNHSLKSVCDNYIFEKIYNLLYNNNIVDKTKIMEYIYIDFCRGLFPSHQLVDLNTLYS